MKAVFTGLILALANAAFAAAPVELAAVGPDQLEAFDVPEWVRAEVVTVDGAPGIRLTNLQPDPLSVTIAEIAVADLDNTQVVYTATMSGTELAAPAYLELNAVVDGNAYFSRALNDVFTGTEDAREISTPFFLQRGQFMEAARLGVRFEGSGTVTLSDMRLLDLQVAPGAMSIGARIGIAGATAGIVTALWCCLACLLAWKGAGRGPVLALTLAVAVAGIAAIAAGVLAFVQGFAWEVGYGLVLIGAITAINFGVFYVVLRLFYRKTEERRMLAMDMQ